MASLGNKIEDTSDEDLNSIAKLLQPVVIHSAVKEGDINKIQKLIDQGVDVNEVCSNGNAPLHTAVIQNDVKTVEFLISLNEINLNVEDTNGNSPLYYACLNGNKTIAGMLTFKDAQFETDNTKLAYILCQKAHSNDLDAIKLFYRAGANLELTNYDKRTCAHVAASEGHESILVYLSKETNFNFDLKDRYGRTPLDEIQDEMLRQTIRQHYLSRMRVTAETANNGSDETNVALK